MGTSVLAGTPLSVPAGAGTGWGSSCTGSVTGAGSAFSGFSSACRRRPAISCRAESSSGDWLRVSTTAADRPSSVRPVSASCQRSSARGTSAFRDCHAPAASVLPAVMLTAHSVAPASSTAPKGRETRRTRFSFFISFTSWDNLCGGKEKHAPGSGPGSVPAEPRRPRLGDKQEEHFRKAPFYTL